MLPWLFSTYREPGTVLSNHRGTQDITPYLIILRVAKWRELANEVAASGSDSVSSIQFQDEGTSTDGYGSISGGSSRGFTQANNGVPEGVGTRAENGIEELPL